MEAPQAVIDILNNYTKIHPFVEQDLNSERENAIRAIKSYKVAKKHYLNKKKEVEDLKKFIDSITITTS